MMNNTCHSDHNSIYIAVIFGLLTSIFSYLNWQQSREKFRHDLFNRRWDFYFDLVKGISHLLNYHYSTVPNEVMRMNEDVKSVFKAENYHLCRVLFGEDINRLYDDLNQSFAEITTYASQDDMDLRRIFWSRKQKLHDQIKKLPDIFSPYLYFGNHKYNQILKKAVANMNTNRAMQ